MVRNKVIIITTNPFPIGLAGTNRILSYSKGFIFHGYFPKVICSRPTEHHKSVFNKSINGMYKGIQFSYPGGTTIRVSTFWGRRWNDLKGMIMTIRRLHNYLKSGDIALIIFYGNSLFTELVCIFISRIYNVKIFKEESENPQVYFLGRTSLITRFHRWFYINKLYDLYNGLLLMTHPLEEYFIEKGFNIKKILVVAQTVDEERFDLQNIMEENHNPNEYVAYVGSLNQLKDGVLSLIESFAIISSSYPKLDLVIAGDGSPEEKSKMAELIQELHLNTKVHYIGRLSSDEIPRFFKNSKLLVSCRPVSLQSDYGFPTKVAEYLASGIPVITTATGEIQYFLKDRINAFVAESADHKIFANKILEALSDYSFALEVAAAGRILAKTHFSPLYQVGKIIEFAE